MIHRLLFRSDLKHSFRPVFASIAVYTFITGILDPCNAQSIKPVHLETQTDWVGDAREGRIAFEWYNTFYSAWGIDRFSMPGSLILDGGFVREPISFEEDYRITSFLPTDVDSDGDIDLFLLQGIDCKIGWLENVNGNSSWLYHNIQDPFYVPRAPASSDFDGNGLTDLAVVSNEDGLYIAFQAEEDIWITRNVDRYFYTGSKLVCFDMNRDGFEDIIGKSRIRSSISWWENPGSDDGEWTKHMLDSVDIFKINVMIVDDYDGDESMEMYLVTSHWPSELRVRRYEEDTYSQSRIDLSPRMTVDRIIGIFPFPESGFSYDDSFARFVTHFNTGRHPFRDELILFEYRGFYWTVDTSLPLDEQGSSRILGPMCSGDIDNDGDQDICTPQYCLENISEDSSWIVHNYHNAGSEQLSMVYDQNAEFEQRLIVINKPLANLVCADIDGNGTEELIYISDYNLWFIDHFSSDRTGELLSDVLLTDESSIWQSITWSSDEPEGTSISFYVRFDDMNSMDWFGPINEPGSLLEYRESSSGTFQYKVVLKSDDPDVTPVLNSVTLTWE